MKNISCRLKIQPTVKYFLLTLLAIASGCVSLPESEQSQLDRMAEQTVSQLQLRNPDLRQRLEALPGYMVADMNVLKVPVLGGGGGRGVVIDNTTGKRTYVRIAKMELGAGWGGRRYKVLLAFLDPELLGKAKSGKWIYQVGAEASVGKAAVESSSDQLRQDIGYEMFVLTDGGASATWTFRTIRLKPYRD